MLIAEDGPHGSICTTDEVSALIEELQYTLGEGPCVDAHREQRPVVEPDLANPDVSLGRRSRRRCWRQGYARCSGSRFRSVR
jgi:hypothetical protein